MRYIERDFYFVAYAATKGYSYEIEDGKVYLIGDKNELSSLKKDYIANHKAFFTIVRDIIRKVNSELIA